MNDGTATLVTVTVRMKEEGNYQCTVSNARVENGTIDGVTATENYVYIYIYIYVYIPDDISPFCSAATPFQYSSSACVLNTFNRLWIP